MKLLFFTDAHIRGDSPKSRIDNYPLALEYKFKTIGKIIKDEKIDAVLNGGDLFHTPAPAYTIVNRFLKIIKTWEVPIYSIHGSHDKFGYNDETIQRTALGIAEITGVLQIINDPIEITSKVFIAGTHHTYELDKNPENYTITRPKGCEYLIQMAHGMLVPHVFPADHTLLTQVQTDADLVLSGHYHAGFSPQTINNTTFMNPGSLSRVDCSQREFLPNVLIIDTITKKVTSRVITDSLEIFDTTQYNTRVDNFTINEFSQLLSDKIDGVEVYDVKKLVISIAEKEQVAPKIIQTALKYIE